MARLTFRMLGTRDDLLALEQEIRAEFAGADVSVASPPTTHDPGPLAGEPLRQVELLDIVLALVVNLASNAMYDQLRAFIETRANAHDVDVIAAEQEPPPSEQPLPKRPPPPEGPLS